MKTCQIGDAGNKGMGAASEMAVDSENFPFAAHVARNVVARWCCPALAAEIIAVVAVAKGVSIGATRQDGTAEERQKQENFHSGEWSRNSIKSNPTFRYRLLECKRFPEAHCCSWEKRSLIYGKYG